MESSLSRSVPLLPRYQSASLMGRVSRHIDRGATRSPAFQRPTFHSPTFRSPALKTGPARSSSVPRSRLLYSTTGGSPHRVFVSPHHQSPSPHRAYRHHLVTTASPSPRVTRRSHSAHDMAASHLYTIPNDAFSGAHRELENGEGSRSVDELYHKGPPFYPDSTRSESGVSLGESELSLMEVESDCLSQNSFGSSSAFFEMTADSELSDTSHGGAATHGTAGQGRGRRRNLSSPDSNRSSPLSYTHARRRELMAGSPSGEYDRVHGRCQQALKVAIPPDSPRGKSLRLSSSSPIAQSTPHVSPRAFGEARLSIKACWNVDDPEDCEFVEEGPQTARELFPLDDSSCNSSFSEDGAADISNVSSLDHQRLRKTKLVKKASDTKPTRPQTKNDPSTSSPTHDVKESSVDGGDNRGVVEGMNERVDVPTASEIVGDEWWAVYNIGSASAREAEEMEEPGDKDANTPSVSPRNVQVVKPVSMPLPLISAGKHGQEKLMRRRSSSQTSPPSTPNSLSPAPRSAPPSPPQGRSDDQSKSPEIAPSPSSPASTKADGDGGFPARSGKTNTAATGDCPRGPPGIQLGPEDGNYHNRHGEGRRGNEQRQDEEVFPPDPARALSSAWHVHSDERDAEEECQQGESDASTGTGLDRDTAGGEGRGEVCKRHGKTGYDYEYEPGQFQGEQPNNEAMVESVGSSYVPCIESPAPRQDKVLVGDDDDRLRDGSAVDRLTSCHDDVTEVSGVSGGHGDPGVGAPGKINGGDVTGGGEEREATQPRAHITTSGSSQGSGRQLAQGAGGAEGVGAPQVFTSCASPPPHGQVEAIGEEEKGGGRGEQNTGAVCALDTVSSASGEEESKLRRDAHSGNEEQEEEVQRFVSRASLIVTTNKTDTEDSSHQNRFVTGDDSESGDISEHSQDQGFCVAQEGSEILTSDGGVSGARENSPCDSSSCAEFPEWESAETAMDWSIDRVTRPGRESPQHPRHPETRRGRVTVVLAATAQRVPDDKSCSEPGLLSQSEIGDTATIGGSSVSAFSSPSNNSACQASLSPLRSHFIPTDGFVDSGCQGVTTFQSNDLGLDGFTSREHFVTDTAGSHSAPRRQEISSECTDRVSSETDSTNTPGVALSASGLTDGELLYPSGSCDIGEDVNSSKCYYTDTGTAEVGTVEHPTQQNVSSQQVRHTERTTTTVEKTVTTERRDAAPSGLVDIVTDTCITKTVTKENDDSITTTTTTSSLYPDSGIGDSSFVSTFNTTVDNLSFDSTLNDSGAQVSGSFPQTDDTPACVPEHTTHSSHHQGAAPLAQSREEIIPASGDVVGSAASRLSESACVPTSEQSARDTYSTYTSTPRLPTARPHNPTNTTGDKTSTCAGDTTVRRPDTDMISDIKGRHSATVHSEPAMRGNTESARLLDSLHAQLTQISSDLSKLDTEDGGDSSNVSMSPADTKNTAYQDHAEATSVLKQIVRGDFTEYDTNAPPVPRLAKFPTSLPCDVDLDLDLQPNTDQCEGQRETEIYDNEADYASTDLPKNGSSRHHHIQLLKPGHQKASSLWTLQEETESLVDATSPRSSPRRAVVSGESKELTTGQTTIRPYRRLSESSEGEESDGRYSSVSSGNSWTDRSSRERTPLSDTEQSMDWAEVNPPGGNDKSFNDFVHGLHSSHESKSGGGGRGLPLSNTFKPGPDHSTSEVQNSSRQTPLRPASFPTSSVSEGQDYISSGLEALDSLTASLEQFSASTGFLSAPESLDNSSSTLEGDRRIGEEFAPDSSSCRLHSLDLDLSRISSCGSPAPSDLSEASNFTCTGTAEVRRRYSLDYDTVLDLPPTPTSNIPSSHTYRSAGKPLKSALKRPLPPDVRDLTENQKETYRRFDELLNEFHSQTSPEAIHEVRFLDDLTNESSSSEPTRRQRHTASKDLPSPPGGNYEQLYKDFTNDDSEKKQNNTCVVVEDENMGGFRFKRFLKKSHNRRNKKGRKVMRFLSRLNCVSESVRSPDMNAHRKQFTSEGQAVTFSTDSMPSPKARKISHPPVFMSNSSQSFQHSQHSQYAQRVLPEDVQHQTVLVEQHPRPPSPPSPTLSSPDKSPTKSTPSSSNQSLDSLRSRTDSAYSSISESTPAGQQLQFAWTPQAGSPTHHEHTFATTTTPGGTGFHSSGDRTLSTDSAFSMTPNSACSSSRTFSVFHDATSPAPYNSSSLDTTGFGSYTSQSSRLASNSPTPRVPAKSQPQSDMLNALSEVFDELDVCEGEIDTALINRLRHGHVQAGHLEKF